MYSDEKDMEMEASSGVLDRECTSPESGDLKFDGFQRYAPAEVFTQALAGLVNQSDVDTIIRAQKQMLQRFEKTNEMLYNCNMLSQNRLKTANDSFKKHMKYLMEMRKDLDYIFRKIRAIKQKIKQQYPQAYVEGQPQHSSLEEAISLDDDSGAVAKSVAPTKTASHTHTNPTSLACTEHSSQAATTVEYVQMEEAVDNGKPIENELIKRVYSIETANPNDSSDCTSEDTG